MCVLWHFVHWYILCSLNMVILKTSRVTFGAMSGPCAGLLALLRLSHLCSLSVISEEKNN